MTQEELGELLGVKKAAIQKYENGSVVNLKPETVKKLAEIFKISPSYIMGWEKFDTKYNLDEIKLELLVIETLQRDIGENAVAVIGAMSMLTDEAKDKIKQYALDLCMIDYYVDAKRRDEIIEKYPTAHPIARFEKLKSQPST